jgi:hypothetical protein
VKPPETDVVLWRLAAQDALTRVFVCADRREWDGLRTLLADTVAVDYTSLNGGEPSAAIAADDLVGAWRQGLGGFESTQHLVGSFVFDEVTQQSVRLRFYAIATHMLRAGHGDSTWTVAGHYEAVLRDVGQGFKLTAITLHVDWAAGNQQLAVLAGQARGT